MANNIYTIYNSDVEKDPQRPYEVVHQAKIYGRIPPAQHYSSPRPVESQRVQASPGYVDSMLKLLNPWFPLYTFLCKEKFSEANELADFLKKQDRWQKTFYLQALTEHVEGIKTHAPDRYENIKDYHEKLLAVQKNSMSDNLLSDTLEASCRILFITMNPEHANNHPETGVNVFRARERAEKMVKFNTLRWLASAALNFIGRFVKKAAKKAENLQNESSGLTLISSGVNTSFNLFSPPKEIKTTELPPNSSRRLLHNKFN